MNAAIELTDLERRCLSALRSSDAGFPFLGIVLGDKPPALRRTLKKLERDGLVTTTAPHGAYSITDEGRAALEDWIARRDAERTREGT